MASLNGQPEDKKNENGNPAEPGAPEPQEPVFLDSGGHAHVDPDEAAAIESEFAVYEEKKVEMAQYNAMLAPAKKSSGDKSVPPNNMSVALQIVIMLTILCAVFIAVFMFYPFSFRYKKEHTRLSEQELQELPMESLEVRDAAQVPTGTSEVAVSFDDEIAGLQSEDNKKVVDSIHAVSSYLNEKVNASIGGKVVNALVNLYLNQTDKKANPDPEVLFHVTEAIAKTASIGMTARFIPQDYKDEILKNADRLFADKRLSCRKNLAGIILGIRYQFPVKYNPELVAMLEDSDPEVGAAVADRINQWVLGNSIGDLDSYTRGYTEKSPAVRRNIIRIYSNVLESGAAIRVATILRRLYLLEQDPGIQLAILQEAVLMPKYRDTRLVILRALKSADKKLSSFAAAEIRFFEYKVLADKDFIFLDNASNEWIVCEYYNPELDKNVFIKRTVLAIGKETVELLEEDYDVESGKTSNKRTRTVNLDAGDYAAESPILPVEEPSTWEYATVKIGGREIECEVLTGKDADGKLLNVFFSPDLHFRGGMVSATRDGKVVYRVIDFGKK